MLTVFILVIIAALMAFYKRSISGIAIVRTGFMGQKVAIHNGIFAIPLLHRYTKINMETMEIEVHRINEKSVLSSDFLRVDIIAHFFIHVTPDKEMVPIAAQTLGNKTFKKDEMEDILEERCEAALIAVVNSTKLDDLHVDKSTFINSVTAFMKDDLATNGLRLQSLAVRHVEQAQPEYFNKQNIMDTQGLTKIERQIADEEKVRVDIATKNEIEIRELKLEADKKGIDVDIELAKEEAEKQQKIDTLQQKAELEVARNHIKKERNIEIFKQEKDKAIASGQKDVATIRIETDKLKAQAAKAAEEVTTARERAQAHRNQEIEVISAEREAKRQQILAVANKEAAILDSEGAKARYQVEAAGKHAINEAANQLSTEQIEMGVRLEIVKQLPEIVKQSVKPIENIDSIKIMEVSGLTGAGSSITTNGDNEQQSTSGGNIPSLPDQVVDSALRYKAHAPIVDGLLRDIGIDGLSTSSISKVLRNELKPPKKSDSSKEVDKSSS